MAFSFEGGFASKLNCEFNIELNKILAARNERFIMIALLMLVAFIVIPIVELALLLFIADKTHWTVPLGLVIGTGALGVLMLRLQGVITMSRIRRAMTESREPLTDPLIDAGFMIFAAGLLLTPGVVTDAVGLSLLFPPTRMLWRTVLKRWFKGRFQFVQWMPGAPGGGHPASGPAGSGDVVDGQVVDGKPSAPDEPRIGE